MTLVLILLLIQGALGALDTIWHHELEVALPSNPGARKELALHAARSNIYGVVFIVFGALRPGGVLAVALAALLAAELFITLEDFLVEDRTRRLPPSERVLHTVMAVGIGIFIAAFAPVFLDWVRLDSGLVVENRGVLGWIAVGMGLLAMVSGCRDALAALTLRAPKLTANAKFSGRTVLVTGGTGFIGAALVERLVARGDRVILLVRDMLSARARFGETPLMVERLDHLPAETRIDAVVNLAGAPIAGGLWTRGRRRVLMQSRLATTRAVLTLIERLEHKPGALINSSAVGFYGDRGDETLDETAGPRPGFLSALCRRWEEEAWLAEAMGVRVCRLRFGLVLDWSGGVLPMLAMPARFGSAAVLGSGRQWAPWIARYDALRLIERALEDDRYEGPINAVSPDLVTQGAFTARLSSAFGWRAWLSVPAAPVRLALGELSDLFLASQKVEPARLEALGFRFERERLESVFSRRARRRRNRPGSADAVRITPA
ncbi:MAG TPA: TIGR01777 family oxidoreductase [Caulobacteraceae bacterium]|jgi:hypothetical protein|nr:TIGR01777 family oxidoreductase [Caulobacteraceae bacterium]